MIQALSKESVSRKELLELHTARGKSYIGKIIEREV
jgi:hypothetical protein